MAVSGRKGADFQSSISKGSAEDFDHRCEPCLAIGQQIESHGFCVDCQEHLCKSCFAYHQRLKANKHHHLVNKDNMDKHAVSKESDECTEKCQVHKKEVIKFFCPKHEALGCNDCIVLNHRACDIDYIPEKCAGIGDSAEFRELLRELDQKINGADNIIKQASNREKELDYCCDKLLKEITMFRKEINDRLDQLQKQIQIDADKKKSTDKQTVNKVLEQCTNISSDIKQLQSRLQDYKTSQQNGQLYITMKQAKSKLKSEEIKEADRSLEMTNMQYTFEQNQDLENILSRQDAFGKLKETTLSLKPWDIAVMPQDKIAVTMSDKKEILIMTTAGKLSTVRKFPVAGDCRGIAYHRGHLYTVCINPKCVFITDTQGKVQNTILLDNKRFDHPSYLLLSKDLRHICINNWYGHSVFSITLQGDISAEYKNKNFDCPLGMMMLDHGSLLVCCVGGIHRISAD
ncbi:E3 ubiquitin-protein ligase TRIM71-like [Mercenaria mercenaria]|uniref:E3 ubiquitin-protein ligase TRIM71-like n=1 Tax=Mercenaria mercenaria TaxID=6596 RepID=UPI00234E8A7A|nr:E3 ubiquitin-protein ligase TRIM71-like [Mercenaria mercenaria]